MHSVYSVVIVLIIQQISINKHNEMIQKILILNGSFTNTCDTIQHFMTLVFSVLL